MVGLEGKNGSSEVLLTKAFESGAGRALPDWQDACRSPCLILTQDAQADHHLFPFQCETRGVVILEAIFLRPKTYSIKLATKLINKHHNIKKAKAGKLEPVDHIAKKKGIPKRLPDEADRLLFGHEKYKDVYYGEAGGRVCFPTIHHTKKLALYTAVQTKAALASLDDKSFWFNPATCIRYGHWKVHKWLKKLREGEDSRRLEIEEALFQDWQDDCKEVQRLLEQHVQALQSWHREELRYLQIEMAGLPPEEVGSSFGCLVDPDWDAERLPDMDDAQLEAYLDYAAAH